MINKEELYELAMELARKCHDCLIRKEEKEGLTIEESLEKMEINHRIIESLSEFKGFLTALSRAEIFNEEDIKGIINFLFPETNLPSEVAEFIKGLEGLDSLK